MSVNSIPSSTPAASTTGSSTTGKSITNGKSMQDEFLQLLTTQLKNQNPLQPVDQTQMLAQLAQFSTLEQMTDLNNTMSSAANFSGLTQGASLIGKYVTTYNSDGSAGPSGMVGSVTMQNNEPYLTIGDNKPIPASQVLTVSTSAPSNGQGL